MSPDPGTDREQNCTCTAEKWCSKACRDEWDAMVSRIADGMARKLTDAVLGKGRR